MDVVSDVLRVLRLSGAVFFTADFPLVCGYLNYDQRFSPLVEE